MQKVCIGHKKIGIFVFCHLEHSLLTKVNPSSESRFVTNNPLNLLNMYNKFMSEFKISKLCQNIVHRYHVTNISGHNPSTFRMAHTFFFLNDRI